MSKLTLWNFQQSQLVHFQTCQCQSADVSVHAKLQEPAAVYAWQVADQKNIELLTPDLEYSFECMATPSTPSGRIRTGRPRYLMNSQG